MYMYEGGVSMPHRFAIGPSSSMEDNGKTDTEHTVSLVSPFLSFALNLLC